MSDQFVIEVYRIQLELAIILLPIAIVLLACGLYFRFKSK
jgi:hypothetical protein